MSLSALTAFAALIGVCSCTATHRFAALPSPLPVQQSRTGSDGGTGASTAPTPRPASPRHPNIVFVLTDDLSTNLLPYMPHVLALAHAGMSFRNYTVTDSLCCPSRASIFTGKFPHDTHIVSNGGPDGGFTGFRDHGDYRSTFATSLYKVGYRTAFFGKYLNAYQPESSQPTTALQDAHGAWVAPGWTTWGAVGGGGYSGYHYKMADGHATVSYRGDARDYMTTVLDEKANAFIRSAAKHPNPFMLEVATFAPHKPYVPAPADEGAFAGIAQPRSPAYNRLPLPPPEWMRGRHELGPAQQLTIQRAWQLRVEDVQAVDRMIGDLEHTVAAAGQAANTVFVFSSDNGYHLGEYTLQEGKQTAFDTDIRVPLIIAGPDIPTNTVNNDVVENIDLRPTFEQLAGAPIDPSEDGHSVVPLLHGEFPPWRTTALIEHVHPVPSPSDPDRQNKLSGNPPSYDAIRTPTWIYVRYQHGDREYYDLATDPYELHNLGPSLSPGKVAALDKIMNALAHCHSYTACWQAGQIIPG